MICGGSGQLKAWGTGWGHLGRGTSSLVIDSFYADQLEYKYWYISTTPTPILILLRVSIGCIQVHLEPPQYKYKVFIIHMYNWYQCCYSDPFIDSVSTSSRYQHQYSILHGHCTRYSFQRRDLVLLLPELWSILASVPVIIN